MRIVSLIVVVLLVVGCGDGPAAPPTAIVPGDRVGPYVIHTSTLRDILGEDSADARKRFADQGLYFEFEQGRELKAVTVMSDRFQLPSGLKVGSTMQEVEAIMGKPDARNVSGEKIAMEALVYSGVTFVPKDNRVAAIRVGG
jgi:hypothetical protein